MSLEGFLLLEEWVESRRSEISARQIKSAIKYKPLDEGGAISSLRLNTHEHAIKVTIKDDSEISYSLVVVSTDKVLESKSIEFTEPVQLQQFLDSMLNRYLSAYFAEGTY
ncbi:hypothetical protein [Reinekea sp.]|jgi:hypothetical protein|uniref:hypothetical protein n=1 Tax=Reinekea sp. TaxID=1970455 RepID=UPI0039891365